MPATDTSEAPETGELTRTQKVAALLVILGTESAGALLRQFSPREIETISREMMRFNLISRELQEKILEEFSEVAVSASTGLSAGLDYTRMTLEKAMGTFKATDMIGRLTPNRTPVGAMQTIAEMDPRHIFNLVRDEQTQTIAFVISYLAPEKAAQLLNLLREDQRDQVIERLASLAPTPIEVAEKVVEVFNAKLGVKQTRALTQTGGITPAADILNAMDKTVSRTMLEQIETRNAELVQAIRKKMFTFEDLLRLQPAHVQRILRETDMKDLTFALKKASEPLKKLLLSNISRRAAETVNDEMAALGAVKLKEVEAAQFRIIDAVRKLEADGEIELGDGSSESEMV
ncbi:MAG: flagellar motor switch protein FliG [Verrucomicrobiota bacterium]